MTTALGNKVGGKDQGRVVRQVCNHAQRGLADPRDIIKKRCEFLETLFPVRVDPASVLAGERQQGMNHLTVVPPGFGLGDVLAGYRASGLRITLDSDLRYERLVHVRQADKAYAVWMDSRTDPDFSLAGWSADKVWREQVPTASVVEYGLHVLETWVRNNALVSNLQSMTICPGTKEHGTDKVPCFTVLGADHVRIGLICSRSVVRDARSRRVVCPNLS